MVGAGLLEQVPVGVQGMEFAFGALLGDQVAKIRGGFLDGVGLDVVETESAVAQAGEQAVEVGGLFFGEFFSGDILDGEGGVHGFISKRRAGSAWPF